MYQNVFQHNNDIRIVQEINKKGYYYKRNNYKELPLPLRWRFLQMLRKSFVISYRKLSWKLQNIEISTLNPVRIFVDKLFSLVFIFVISKIYFIFQVLFLWN